jgi:hypothetical protein
VAGEVPANGINEGWRAGERDRPRAGGRRGWTVANVDLAGASRSRVQEMSENVISCTLATGNASRVTLLTDPALPRRARGTDNSARRNRVQTALATG